MPFTNLLNQINIALNKYISASANIINPVNIIDDNLLTVGSINDNLDGNFIIDLDGIFTLAKQTISPTPPETKMGLEIEFNTDGTTPPLPTGTWTVETSKDDSQWDTPINITLPSTSPYIATVYFPAETYAQLVRINIPAGNQNVEIKECRIYQETQITMATNLYSDTTPIQDTINCGSRLPQIVDPNSPYEKWVNVQGDTNIDAITKGCFVYLKKGITQYPNDTTIRNYGIVADKALEKILLHLTFTAINEIQNPPHGTPNLVGGNNIVISNTAPALIKNGFFGKSYWCANGAINGTGTASYIIIPIIGQQGSYNLPNGTMIALGWFTYNGSITNGKILKTSNSSNNLIELILDNTTLKLYAFSAGGQWLAANSSILLNLAIGDIVFFALTYGNSISYDKYMDLWACKYSGGTWTNIVMATRTNDNNAKGVFGWTTAHKIYLGCDQDLANNANIYWDNLIIMNWISDTYNFSTQLDKLKKIGVPCSYVNESGESTFETKYFYDMGIPSIIFNKQIDKNFNDNNTFGGDDNGFWKIKKSGATAEVKVNASISPADVLILKAGNNEASVVRTSIAKQQEYIVSAKVGIENTNNTPILSILDNNNDTYDGSILTSPPNTLPDDLNAREKITLSTFSSAFQIKYHNGTQFLYFNGTNWQTSSATTIAKFSTLENFYVEVEKKLNRVNINDPNTWYYQYKAIIYTADKSKKMIETGFLTDVRNKNQKDFVVFGSIAALSTNNYEFYFDELNFNACQISRTLKEDGTTPQNYDTARFGIVNKSEWQTQAEAGQKQYVKVVSAIFNKLVV